MDQLHCVLIEFNHSGQKKGLLFHICVFLQLHLTVLTVFLTCFSSEPAMYHGQISEQCALTVSVQHL